MKMLDIVLHAHNPLTADEIANLDRMGLHLVSSLGEQIYRVRGTSDASLAELQVLSYVADVSEFAPQEKLDEALIQEAHQVTVAAMGAPAPTVSVLVSLDRHAADVSATLDSLTQIGEVKESTKRRVLVKVSTDKINEVATLPGVLAAEIEPENRTQNNIARNLTRTGPVADNLNLDGSGEIVGVADSGLDTGVNNAGLLADFAGRVVNIRATVNKAVFGVADGADLNNHGTHVSGSILSDGANSNGNLRGMAPAAQLTMLSMGPDNSTSLNVPFDLITGVFQDAYDDGARLHSNSWSSNAVNAPYTAFSEDVDQFIRDNPDMLILIAAGNAGPGASTVRSPGTAKNCLTVGASESVRPLPTFISINPNLQDTDFNSITPNVDFPLQTQPTWDQQADNADDIANFSGRGPTVDDRIKPDLVAPGSWILSCRSTVSTADVGPDGLSHQVLENPPGSGNFPYADDADGMATHGEAVGRGLPGASFFGTWDQNTPDAPPGSGPNYQQNYFYDSGTSMATPITTGTAVLLRQYLRQRRGITNPSAALMKAMLVNGATVPAGASNVPDNNRGFGWLNLENTLTPAPTGQQAYSDDVDLAVATDDIRSFSIQLAQTGHPFRITLVWNDEPGSGIQNKLYLRVIAPDGTVSDGDVTPFPTVSNNVQRVHIETPIAGTYTIEVHGIEVLFGIDAHPGQIRQDFALAIINGIGFSPEPVDISQVIDKSGSMGSYGYMESAKERAKQLVDMLRINDRTGTVAFNGTASPIHAVVPIDGLLTQNAIKTDIDGIMSGGVTSIGAGLELGQAGLAAGGDASHPQAIVLLSDGHENTPPWVGGGVTDSPPSWYSGSDVRGILPTVSAGTKIYTVSLGVQSDQVLLQDIANATGGVFHAIHSPAEIGKLHEIYVHLQALTGGEVVIAASSDNVDGLNFGEEDTVAGTRAGADKDTVDGALLSDLRGLINISAIFPEPHRLRRLRTTRIHQIPVDESLSSVTMMVSWHDPKIPVSLTLISPSHQTIHTGSPLHFNHLGSSYQFFRIENPEPGRWQMIVRADRTEADTVRRSHAYTWGAYGKSPLGIRYRIPKQLLGLPKLKITASVAGQRKIARTVRFTSSVNVPRLPVHILLKKYRDHLTDIDLPFKLDNPKVDPDLFKLALLDKRMQERGGVSIFRTQLRRLRLTRNNRYTDVIETPLPGLYIVQLAVTGRSRKGFLYRRQTHFNVRT